MRLNLQGRFRDSTVVAAFVAPALCTDIFLAPYIVIGGLAVLMFVFWSISKKACKGRLAFLSTLILTVLWMFARLWRLDSEESILLRLSCMLLPVHVVLWLCLTLVSLRKEFAISFWWLSMWERILITSGPFTCTYMVARFISAFYCQFFTFEADSLQTVKLCVACHTCFMWSILLMCTFYAVVQNVKIRSFVDIAYFDRQSCGRPLLTLTSVWELMEEGNAVSSKLSTNNCKYVDGSNACNERKNMIVAGQKKVVTPPKIALKSTRTFISKSTTQSLTCHNRVRPDVKISNVNVIRMDLPSQNHHSIASFWPMAQHSPPKTIYPLDKCSQLKYALDQWDVLILPQPFALAFTILCISASPLHLMLSMWWYYRGTTIQMYTRGTIVAQLLLQIGSTGLFVLLVTLRPTLKHYQTMMWFRATTSFETKIRGSFFLQKFETQLHND